MIHYPRGLDTFTTVHIAFTLPINIYAVYSEQVIMLPFSTYIVVSKYV